VGQFYSGVDICAHRNRLGREIMNESDLRALPELTQQTIEQATRPALTNHERLAIEPIEVLGLTLRTANCLKTDSVHYVGDLLRHTEQTLSGRSSLGIVQFQKINGVMAAQGLRLAEPHRLV
jgi:DNA-directed RNA polymerase alpha subunit